MTVQVTRIDDTGADGLSPRTATTLAVLPVHPVGSSDRGSTAAGVIHPSVSLDTTARDTAIEDLLQLLEASRRLQATLMANDEMCDASVRKMMGGTTPAAVLTDIDVAGARLDLTETLGAFERARHRSRSTFIAAQFDSGMNMKEIGRNWAISRQLAHRFFKEACRDG